MARDHHYWVYMVTTWNNSVLYTGVTNDIFRRMGEHKNGRNEGFTKRYSVHKLVYQEHFTDIDTAIAREKQIKGWTRAKKNALIAEQNPYWKDLARDWDI